MTRNEWKLWYEKLCLGRQWNHPDILNAIADMGEQVDLACKLRELVHDYENPDRESSGISQ